jgi:hypothetical protein
MKNAWVILLFVTIVPHAQGMEWDSSASWDISGKGKEKEKDYQHRHSVGPDLGITDDLLSSLYDITASSDTEKEVQTPAAKTMWQSPSQRRRALSLSLNSKKSMEVKKGTKRRSLGIRSESQFALKQSEVSVSGLTLKSKGLEQYDIEPSPSDPTLDAFLAWLKIVRGTVPESCATAEDLAVTRFGFLKFWVTLFTSAAQQHDDYENTRFGKEEEEAAKAVENNFYMHTNLLEGQKCLKHANVAYEEALLFENTITELRIEILERKMHLLWSKNIKDTEIALENCKNEEAKLNKYGKKIETLNDKVLKTINTQGKDSKNEKLSGHFPIDPTTIEETLMRCKKRQEKKRLQIRESRLTIVKEKLSYLLQKNGEEIVISKPSELEEKLRTVENLMVPLWKKCDGKAKVTKKTKSYGLKIKDLNDKRKVYYNWAEAYCKEAQQFFREAKACGDKKSNLLKKTAVFSDLIKTKIKNFNDYEKFEKFYISSKKIIKQAENKEKKMMSYDDFINFIKEKRLKTESPRKRTARLTKINKSHKKINKYDQEKIESIIKKLNALINKKNETDKDKNPLLDENIRLQIKECNKIIYKEKIKFRTKIRDELSQVLKIPENKKESKKDDIYYKTIINYKIEKRIFNYIEELLRVINDYIQSSYALFKAFEVNHQLEILVVVQRNINIVKHCNKKINALNREFKSTCIDKATLKQLKYKTNIKMLNASLDNNVDFVVRIGKPIGQIYDRLNLF